MKYTNNSSPGAGYSMLHVKGIYTQVLAGTLFLLNAAFLFAGSLV